MIAWQPADRRPLRPSRLRAAMVLAPRAWVGVVAVTSAAVWLGVLGTEALARSGSLVQSLRVAQGEMIGPALVAVVVVAFLAERRWPAVARPWRARAHLVDLGYLAAFAVVIGPLVTLVDTGFGVAVDRYAHPLILTRFLALPRAAMVVAILVGMDAMNWLAHVLNHRHSPLWRLHALHHSQEDMNVFTTFRTHPLTHVTYLPALLPALVLGASGTVPAAALIAYSAMVTVSHANLPWGYGPLGRIVVSPAYHRLHHSREAVEGRPVVNFGFALVCWDRLFGTAAYPAGTVTVQTGIARRPVRVEQGARLREVPGVVCSQLIQPFSLRSATDGRP